MLPNNDLKMCKRKKSNDNKVKTINMRLFFF